MKAEVTHYVAGKVSNEVIQAHNYADAQLTALARNPTARVVSFTAVFN